MSTKQNILEALELARELVEEGIFLRNHLNDSVEFLNEDGDWCRCSSQYVFNPFDGYKYRRKQKTITVNGVEVPAPIYAGLMDRELYYVIDQAVESGYAGYYFNKDDTDKSCLKRGVYTNEDHIKQYVKALWGE